MPANFAGVEKNWRDRLIGLAARHPAWVVGYADEVWWSRLAQPAMHAWGEPLRLHAKARRRTMPNPRLWPATDCCAPIRTSPLAVTPATSCALRSRATASGPLRSSSDPTPPRASSFYRAGGLLNEPSPGLAAADVSPRTGRQPSRAPPHGHSSPASG